MPKGTGHKPTATALIRENERLRVELETLRRSRLASNVASILRETFRWLIIGYFGWRSVGELAGKATFVDAAVDVCGSLGDALKELAPNWFVQIATFVVLVALGVVVARLRRLNKGLKRRLGDIVPRYEREFDPNRSSSGLSADGETHRRDEV